MATESREPRKKSKKSEQEQHQSTWTDEKAVQEAFGDVPEVPTKVPTNASEQPEAARQELSVEEAEELFANASAPPMEEETIEPSAPPAEVEEAEELFANASAPPMEDEAIEPSAPPAEFVPYPDLPVGAKITTEPPVAKQVEIPDTKLVEPSAPMQKSLTEEQVATPDNQLYALVADMSDIDRGFYYNAILRDPNDCAEFIRRSSDKHLYQVLGSLTGANEIYNLINNDEFFARMNQTQFINNMPANIFTKLINSFYALYALKKIEPEIITGLLGHRMHIVLLSAIEKYMNNSKATRSNADTQRLAEDLRGHATDIINDPHNLNPLISMQMLVKDFASMSGHDALFKEVAIALAHNNLLTAFGVGGDQFTPDRLSRRAFHNLKNCRDWLKTVELTPPLTRLSSEESAEKHEEKESVNNMAAYIKYITAELHAASEAPEAVASALDMSEAIPEITAEELDANIAVPLATAEAELLEDVAEYNPHVIKTNRHDAILAEFYTQITEDINIIRHFLARINPETTDIEQINMLKAVLSDNTATKFPDKWHAIIKEFARRFGDFEITELANFIGQMDIRGDNYKFAHSFLTENPCIRGLPDLSVVLAVLEQPIAKDMAGKIKQLRLIQTFLASSFMRREGLTKENMSKFLRRAHDMILEANKNSDETSFAEIMQIIRETISENHLDKYFNRIDELSQNEECDQGILAEMAKAVSVDPNSLLQYKQPSFSRLLVVLNGKIDYYVMLKRFIQFLHANRLDDPTIFIMVNERMPDIVENFCSVSPINFRLDAMIKILQNIDIDSKTKTEIYNAYRDALSAKLEEHNKNLLRAKIPNIDTMDNSNNQDIANLWFHLGIIERGLAIANQNTKDAIKNYIDTAEDTVSMFQYKSIFGAFFTSPLIEDDYRKKLLNRLDMNKIIQWIKENDNHNEKDTTYLPTIVGFIKNNAEYWPQFVEAINNDRVLRNFSDARKNLVSMIWKCPGIYTRILGYPHNIYLNCRLISRARANLTSPEEYVNYINNLMIDILNLPRDTCIEIFENLKKAGINKEYLDVFFTYDNLTKFITDLIILYQKGEERTNLVANLMSMDEIFFNGTYEIPLENLVQKISESELESSATQAETNAPEASAPPTPGSPR